MHGRIIKTFALRPAGDWWKWRSPPTALCGIQGSSFVTAQLQGPSRFDRILRKGSSYLDTRFLSTLITSEMSLLGFADEILLQISSNLTSHELYQLSLSCRALSRVAFETLSRSIRLDYAYRDDRSVWKLNGFISQLKRRSGSAVSGITTAHLAWPNSSVQLRRRMLHILSILTNAQTLHLKEHFGPLHGLYIRNDTARELEENLYDVFIRSRSASSVRSLKIADTRISAHDILKLLSLKQLEHLSIDGFNNPMAVIPDGEIRYSQLESLAISTSTKPTGRHTDLLLGRTPGLKKFTWNFDFREVLNEEKFRQILSPAAISKALSPLRQTLVELDISMGRTWFRNDETVFNLSDFLVLKVLRIHDRVLFSSESGIGVVASPSLDLRLSRRLPPNLENLDVSIELELKSSVIFRGEMNFLTLLSCFR
jgi:hypothetical protein